MNSATSDQACAPQCNFNKPLVFVGGKGGVGKTVVSQAIALRLNQLGRRVLWCTFEDPIMPSHQLNEVRPGLFYLNCEASQSFEEYAAIKIGAAGLARIFLRNKLMQYLAKAAPGIHELVLLGKVWYERKNYDHVVVDMPSTGYALAMFQSTRNFARLFQGGPINRDAEEMLATFDNPSESAHWIVSLPEEMPLRESLELRGHLLELFPRNPPEFLANRIFPALENSGGRDTSGTRIDPEPENWKSPVASDGEDYARKRVLLEKSNLRIWDEEPVTYRTLAYEIPQAKSSNVSVVEGLARQLEARGYA